MLFLLLIVALHMPLFALSCNLFAAVFNSTAYVSIVLVYKPVFKALAISFAANGGALKLT